MAAELEDDRLVDLWESQELGRSVSHREHLRIAWILFSRHGIEDGGRRLMAGTRDMCVALDALDRYDEDLSRRWTDLLGDAFEAEPGRDPEGFISLHLEFLRGDLLGPLSWKQAN
jgi:hypothetical protein